MDSTDCPAYPRPADLPALLALDASRRAVGVAGGLVPLEALAPMSWDFSAPTLTAKAQESYQERKLCPDSAAFAREFYRVYPALQGVPLDGLLVAGGAAGQFLPRLGAGPRIGAETREWTAADVDIFLYGHATPAASQARLRKFIADLDSAAHRFGREQVAGRMEAAEAKRAAARHPASGSDAVASAVCRRLLKNFGTLAFAQREPEGPWALSRPENVSESDWGLLLAYSPDLHYSLPDVTTVRTAGSITIESNYDRFQVVLRHYATASEVLHGFDLGPAAVGFDGARVWLTEMGRFSYERRCLVVDTGRRSLTFEARLAKYHGRGFALVLPGLSVAALSRRNLRYGYAEVADLPGFPFAYSAIAGNRIEFTKFPKDFGASSDYGSDGDADGNAGLDDEDSFALAYMNLYRLVQGRTDFVYTSAGTGFAGAAAVLAKLPHLSLEMMHGLYDRFRSACWDGARLNTRALERYVPAVPVNDIAAAVFVEGRPMGAVLDEAFAAQREVATGLWMLRIRDADHSVLPWVTENPGGQQGPLTGSRHPIAEDPAAWYGEYFAAPTATAD